MTWNELNERTGDMLPDMIGPSWDEWMDDDMGEEELYRCQALEMVEETLQEIAMTMPFNYDAEYLENQQLRKELAAVGKIR